MVADMVADMEVEMGTDMEVDKGWLIGPKLFRSKLTGMRIFYAF